MARRAFRPSLIGLAGAAAILLLGAIAARAQATSGPAPAAPGTLGIGPFRLGMSLDEIRAAAPQIEWRNVMVSRYTGRVFSMRSDGTFPIAGVEFEIGALSHYYEHQLLLEGTRQVDGAAACERAGLELLTAIEAQAGPFASDPPVTTPASGGGLYWQTQRAANGSIAVMPAPAAGTPGRTDGETLAFGNGSTALVEAFDDQYRPRARVKRLGGPPAFLRLSAHNRGTARNVQAEINYGGSGVPSCAMRVELQGWVQPPLPQSFDTSRARVTREATIAERHLVHAPVAGQPGPALDIEMACEIDRRTGWAMGCGIVRPDDVSREQEQVAYNLARLVVYDMSAVDRDDPQAMRGTLRVRVDPAARRPVDFLAAPRTPIAEIEFTERPDPETAQVFAPVLGEAEGAGVEVSLVCRVESDGSLICADPVAATDPDRRAIVAKATRIAASGYRVAPALRSGAPSAGKVFDLAVEVQREY
jgi:hypothetical protein